MTGHLRGDARKRATEAVEAWEQVVQLAAKADRQTNLADDEAVAVGWGEAEPRTEGEISEALAQAWDEGWHEANWDGTTTNPYRGDA